MAENYYRLVFFVCKICADVMRDVLLHLVKADCHEKCIPFTNLNLYIQQYRKPEIMYMKRTQRLRLDQVNRILTSNGETDLKLWDISTLIVAIKDLFPSRMNEEDRIYIEQIRSIRNKLVHTADAQITDDKFSDYWFRLREATLKLARNIQGTKYEEEIQAKIDDAEKDRASESVDTLREWFKETVVQLQDEFEKKFENMRSEMDDMRNYISSIKHKVKDDDAKTNNQSVGSQRLRTETESEQAFISTSLDPGFSAKKTKTTGQFLQETEAEIEKVTAIEKVSVSTTVNITPIWKDNFYVSPSLENVNEYRDIGLESQLAMTGSELFEAPYTSRRLPRLESQSEIIRTEEYAGELNSGGLLHEVAYPKGLPPRLKNQWENVISVEDARALISNGLLPNEHGLPDVVHRFGRKSDIVELLCKAICKKIASASPNFIHVFAAYTLANRDKLHFVVLLENESSSDEDFNLDHEIVFRNFKGDEKTEHEHIKKETESELSAKESTALKNTINKVTKQYMENHKYLSAITARKISFEGRETPCIVMYVHPCTDRYSNIPHNEEPLPATIKGYKVVVRNGVFTTATKTASEYHDNVLMGCQITSDLASGFGTLGGFIDHHEYGLCGFTCAHVVYGTEKMKSLKKKKRLKRSPEEDPCLVHQPSISPVPIGRVVEAFCTEGGDSETAGVDLALFQIEARPPITGTFPRCDVNEKYVSGKTWGRARLNPDACEVYKFGSVTGFTHGKVMFDGMSLKEPLAVAKNYINGVDIILYNQYEIENDTVNVCEQGDSGGLVFMKDCAGELICIGMVIGVINTVNLLHGVVTPITDILRELNVQHLKPFRKQLTLDLLEKKLSENAEAARVQQETSNSNLLLRIESYIDKRVSKMEEVQTAKLQSINESITKIIGGVEKTTENEVKSALHQCQTHGNNKDTELKNCGGT